MDPLIKDLVADVGVGMIEDTEQFKKLKKAIKIVDDFQLKVLDIANIDDPVAITALKSGTVLSFAMLVRKLNGKNPQDYKQADWKEIWDQVSEYALTQDDGQYSRMVFTMYGVFLSKAANRIVSLGESEKEEAILKLVDELHKNEAKLDEGKITEVKFIEENLWICLEAVMKLLSAYSSIGIRFFTGSDELVKLSDAIFAYSFQYARFKLFQRERVLITEYLNNQKVLDAKLRAKFEAYINDLKALSLEFNGLIANAFDPNFRTSLMNSVALAQAAGVPEEETLKSLDEVDDFFEC